MKMIVGLGNPGAEYSRSRHNAGFMTADLLAERWNTPQWKNSREALVTEHRNPEEEQRILLVKPQTYMNLSGIAVGAILRWHKIQPRDLVVIYDDLDLPVGKLRLRVRGSSGGHNGLESVLQHLGTDEFVRVRIGIGRPLAGQEVISHVLHSFSAEQWPVIVKVIATAADAVEVIIKQGAQMAMDRYNRR